MYIRCWGSRGSLPVSGPEFNKYGGDTTCMEIRSKKGDLIIIDAGSGIRGLGRSLAGKKVKNCNMLFTHAHLDHIMGFPFFNPVFMKGTTITIHGCSFNLPSYREILKGLMEAPYFPVDLDTVPARLTFKNPCAQPFTIGAISIQPIFLSHPNGGLGFRFEEDGSSFVFLTDNELDFPHPGGLSFDDYASFARGADLLIHDAEFSPEDYKHNRSWGHSLFTDAVRLGMKAKAKRLGLFHLNKERTDAQVDAIVKQSKALIKKHNSSMQCCAVGASFEITV
jgi:phosphoribosyl 1,2-cyclic phosphodiesterase